MALVNMRHQCKRYAARTLPFRGLGEPDDDRYFDTLRLLDKLKAAGIPLEQAEAVVRVIAEAQDGVVTRDYLDSKLEKEIAPVRIDLAVIKWMMGVLLAGVLSLILKNFF